jgi:hypothetical protein
LLTDAPHEYMRISSGLGEARASNFIVLPALFEGEVKAVLELAVVRALQCGSHAVSSIS